MSSDDDRREFREARLAGLARRNRLRLTRAQEREHTMTRATRDAQRAVANNLVGAAAMTLLEDQQIKAVEEIRSFLVEARRQSGELPAEWLADPAALVEAEAEALAEAGDSTAPVWFACAESMRNRAAIEHLTEED